MPLANHFRHQAYNPSVPTSPHHLLELPSCPPDGSKERGERMQQGGDALRRAGVTTVYLVHGTFVGTDALGFLTDLCRIYPELAAWVARLGKQVADRVSGDAGNYTGNYARRFEESINARGEAYIPVRRFFWSSQNNHIGRADGAVRLLDELASLGAESRGRILLWGHSHAGNVFSLITNLLAADGETLER